MHSYALSSLQRYRNHGTRIVIIHDSERIGMGNAKVLFQRGFNNVHLLRGGVHEFGETYPKFVDGKEAELIHEESNLSY